MTRFNSSITSTCNKLFLQAVVTNQRFFAQTCPISPDIRCNSNLLNLLLSRPLSFMQNQSKEEILLQRLYAFNTGS